MIDLEQILPALSEAGIEFIIVGGVAAIVHGSARLTQDLDIVYRRNPDNIVRLASALKPFAPYLRGAPPGLPFRWDAETIQRGSISLSRPAPALWTFWEKSRAEAPTRPYSPTAGNCPCLELSATASDWIA